LIKGQALEGEALCQFETEFAKYIGAKYAVLISSGRSALFHILKTLDYKPDDEIVLSSYNYYVVPEVIRLCGLRPVFCDIELSDYNISTKAIESAITRRTRAIIATHMYGHPCDMEGIYSLAKRHNLDIIEDCAHSCGSEYKGIKTGALGRVALFSFSMPKALTTFRGGAITTDDKRIYDSIKRLNDGSDHNARETFSDLTFGLAGYLFFKPWFFACASYPVLLLMRRMAPDLLSKLFDNEPKRLTKGSIHSRAKFNNLKASVGMAQLRRLDSMIEKRRRVSELLIENLESINGISLPRELPGARHNYLYFNILFDNPKLLSDRLYLKGVDTESSDFRDCSSLEIFKRYYSDSPNAQYASSHILRIPNFSVLAEKKISYVAESIRRCL